jgi:preprotein translocase subunit SecB
LFAKSKEGYGEIVTLMADGNKMVQFLWKTVQQFLKELSIEIPYNPEILLQEKQKHIATQRAVQCKMFIAALFTIVKNRQQPKCPSTKE